MPSTHCALYFHLVFSTKNREPLLGADLRSRVHTYLGGIVRGQDGVALAVGGVGDHAHLLVSLKATHRLSDVMRELKSDSTSWIKGDLGVTNFAWH